MFLCNKQLNINSDYFSLINKKGVLVGGMRTRGACKYSYVKRIKGNSYVWYCADNDKNCLEPVDEELNNKIDSYLIKNNMDLDFLPLISVVTVVYNGEGYIEDTILSIINQTYPNIEYIIIDGGSSDGTVDIIKKYDAYIDYWISEPDDGIYHAMNKGLAIATGFYVAILNADDVYLPNAVEDSIKAINESGADYSIAQAEHMDYKLIIKPIIPLKKKVYQEMPYPHVTAFIGKHVYNDVGFFDTSFKIAADHDMALRIIAKGYSYVYLDKVIAKLKGGGISDSFAANREFMRVAVKNGRPWLIAFIALWMQRLNNMARAFLPDKIITLIKGLKKSRHVNVKQ